MDNFGSFPFLLFPREIQLHVLFYLEAPDILRFREVSKVFLGLASDTTAAYNVQLDIVGMVDNPSQGLPLIERHKRLLQYREGWMKAVPCLDPNMPVRLVRDPDSSSYWEWTGGVFPYVVNPQSSQQMLHLYSPGSPVRGLETKRWSVEAGSLPNGYRMLGCGIDKAQDLLVLSLAPLHFNPDSEEVYILQLLSLQKPGVPHLSASRHLLSRGLRLLTDRPEIRPPQIRGDTLACAVENNIWEVEVWNWKTGTLLLCLRPSDFFHGFALLSQSHVLISEDVDVVRNDGSLKMYWINPETRLRQQSDDFEHVGPDVVLKLMPFVAGIDCLTWLSHSPETTSPDGVPPFTYDDDLSIFALFFVIQFFGPRPPRSRASEQFLLLISIRKLLCFLDSLRVSAEVESASQPSTQAQTRRSLQVEWDAWGPSTTRLVAFKCAVWNTMPSTSRTRCAVAVRGVARDDPYFDYVLLLSAHPHAALHQCEGAHTLASSGSASHGGDVAIRLPDAVSGEEAAIAAELVSYGDVVTHPKVFRSPVRTTLPISVLCKRVPQRHGPDFARHVEIGLFEDGLSLMYLYRVDGAMRGDTFTFSV